MRLFHITSRAEWERAQATGEYRPPSLASEGFVHLSRDRQWRAVADRLFRGRPDLVLLSIRRDGLRSELREEDADGDRYPHLYGPLNTDAVVAALPLPVNDDGSFAVPPELAPPGLALRYRGHRCTDESIIKPWYFAGGLELTVGEASPIPRAGLTLGRGATADVRVASNGVARLHVRLAWQEGVLVAEDLGSTNGIEVNGVRQEKSVLASGDTLTLAGYFDFEIVDATE
jgi:uncharacterized protein (DUF952 family)